MLPLGPLHADQSTWVEGLVARYAETARTRMAGLPVCHPGLQVAAVGFQAWTDAHEHGAEGTGILGVLVTPWFMNLVWKVDGDAPSPWLTLALGTSRVLTLGAQQMSFIGAHEVGLGTFACCSLISPMFQFADQAAALATAEAVMATLVSEAQAAEVSRLAARLAQAAAEPAMPARRGFLFGRATTAVEPTP